MHVQKDRKEKNAVAMLGTNASKRRQENRLPTEEDTLHLLKPAADSLCRHLF